MTHFLSLAGGPDVPIAVWIVPFCFLVYGMVCTAVALSDWYYETVTVPHWRRRLRKGDTCSWIDEYCEIQIGIVSGTPFRDHLGVDMVWVRFVDVPTAHRYVPRSELFPL